MYYILIAIPTLSLLALFWYYYCNNKACKQRKKLLLFLCDCLEDPRFKTEELVEALEEFEGRAYLLHFMRLLKLQDPYIQYPKTMRLRHLADII